MSRLPEDHERQIAEIEAALKLSLPAAAREQLEQTLQRLRNSASRYQQPISDGRGDYADGDIDKRRGVFVDGGNVIGPVVGINLGEVIYGRSPSEDEQRRLGWYLRTLATKLSHLPLRAIATDVGLDRSRGLSLARLYTSLATQRTTVVALGTRVDMGRYFKDGDPTKALKPAYDPRYVLPSDAIVRVASTANLATMERNARQELAQGEQITLQRALLVTNVVLDHRQMVLLGDPGSGKSTFLRHLAWALALRGLDQLNDSTALFGWEDDRRFLPILLPLRKLADSLSAEGVHDAIVYATLRDGMRDYGVEHVEDLLTASLHHGVTLLLFDGLDEVPPVATASTVDQHIVLRAIRSFMTAYPHVMA